MSYTGEGKVANDQRVWDGTKWVLVKRPLTQAQTLSATGSWDGLADYILVTGTGSRVITLPKPTVVPRHVTVIDAAGNAATDAISVIAGGGGTISGLSSVALNANHAALALVFVSTAGAGSWVKSALPDPAGQGLESVAGVLRTAAKTATLNSVGGTQNNLALGTTDHLQIDATTTITGFSGGYAGRHLFITLSSGVTCTIPNESGSSTATNTVRTPDSEDVVLGTREGCHLVYEGARWRVVGISKGRTSNAELANMTAGTQKGRQIDAGSGVPVDLTGTEQFENLRWDTTQTIASASGALDVTLNADATRLAISSIGDCSLDTITGASGDPGRILLVEHIRASGSGILTVDHAHVGAPAGTSINCPDSTDHLMGHRHNIVLVARSGAWQVVAIAGALQPMAAGTVRGRQIDAATGLPVDLSGEEVGELIRSNNVVTDSTSSGVLTNYLGVANTTTHLKFLNVTVELHSIAVPAQDGQRLTIFHIGTGSTTLVQDSTSEATNSRRLEIGAYAQNATPIVMVDNCAETFVHVDGRWRRISTEIGAGQVTTTKVADHAVGFVKLVAAAAAPSVIGASVNGDFGEMPQATLASLLRGVGLTVDSSGKLRPRARPRRCNLQDFFVSGNLTSGSIGALGWNLLGAGTPALTKANGNLNTASKLTLATSAATNDRSVLCLGEVENRGLALFGSSAVAEVEVLQSTWNFNGSLTTKRFYFGYHANFAQEPSAATDCLGIYYDSAVSANYLLITRSAGVGTPVDSGVAVPSNTTELCTIHRTGTASYNFRIGNTSIGTISSGLPSANGNLGFRLETLASSSASVRIGYFGLTSVDLVGAADDDAFLEV